MNFPKLNGGSKGGFSPPALSKQTSSGGSGNLRLKALKCHDQLQNFWGSQQEVPMVMVPIEEAEGFALDAALQRWRETAQKNTDGCGIHIKEREAKELYDLAISVVDEKLDETIEIIQETIVCPVAKEHRERLKEIEAKKQAEQRKNDEDRRKKSKLERERRRRENMLAREKQQKEEEEARLKKEAEEKARLEKEKEEKEAAKKKAAEEHKKSKSTNSVIGKSGKSKSSGDLFTIRANSSSADSAKKKKKYLSTTDHDLQKIKKKKKRKKGSRIIDGEEGEKSKTDEDGDTIRKKKKRKKGSRIIDGEEGEKKRKKSKEITDDSEKKKVRKRKSRRTEEIKSERITASEIAATASAPNTNTSTASNGNSNSDSAKSSDNSSKPAPIIQRTGFLSKPTTKKAPPKKGNLSSFINSNQAKTLKRPPNKMRGFLGRPPNKEAPVVEEEEEPLITVTRVLVNLPVLLKHVVAAVDEVFTDEKFSAMRKAESDNTYDTDGKPFYCYFVSEKGVRKNNEDEFVCIEHANEWLGVDSKKKMSFFGMYDGHNGNHAAVYTRIHMHRWITQHEKFWTDIDSAIIDGFEKTDLIVNNFQEINKFCCGATAIMAYIIDNEMIVGNVGDSQGVLCRNGKHLEISTSHNPGLDSENARVKAAGGTVVCFGTWRVNGLLAVSRSIGDCLLKKLVIATPEITRFKLTKEDEFVIFATDGLWDVMPYDEVVPFTKKIIAEKGHEAVAQTLANEALDRKSKDNVTVLCVFFNWDSSELKVE